MPENQTRATKADIQLLMEQMGKLYDASERWKDDFLGANEGWKEEIIRHIDVRFDDLRHDLLGAAKDRLENHEDRIGRLERGTRLAG